MGGAAVVPGAQGWPPRHRERVAVVCSLSGGADERTQFFNNDDTGGRSLFPLAMLKYHTHAAAQVIP